MAERALLRTLFAGCLSPVGSFTQANEQRLNLEGVVLSRDGQQRIHSTIEGELEFAEQMGVELAEQLKAQGADRLLRQNPQ